MVTVTAVPAGTSPVQQSPLAGSRSMWLGGFLRSLLKASAVGPDTMENNGDLAGNSYLGLLGTDPASNAARKIGSDILERFIDNE
jgi:hypothetical protein